MGSVMGRLGRCGARVVGSKGIAGPANLASEVGMRRGGVVPNVADRTVECVTNESLFYEYDQL